MSNDHSALVALTEAQINSLLEILTGVMELRTAGHTRRLLEADMKNMAGVLGQLQIALFAIEQEKQRF